MSTSQTYGTGQGGGSQGTGSAVKDTAKEHASQVGQSAGQAASQVADTSKQQVAEVAQEAKAQARDLAGELKTQVTSQAGAQRDRAVTSLHSLSDELEQMARGEGSGEGTLAEVARQAAERLRTVASRIEGREPADLLDDLRSYAARRPMAFLAGAAVAGLVAGRITRGAKDAHSSSGGQQRPALPAGQSAYADTPGYATPGYGTGTGFATTAGAAGDAAPYGGTGAPPLGTTTTGHDALGERNPTTGPLATGDDVLDLDAPTRTRGDAGGGAL
ncbi:hypothetical protein [Vallicoccus soli]|uniref:DUF3618 domain-containing protein n=1 Tax=Vallicoccus soli TaxID=2339232 RepID=A0A3A3ZLX0_9ACTN|nr:hypothetical protein [Vallicoccus soli]RJK97545.1 hypothetical protein D5H78_00430 [Vallicoccus soli]